MADTAADVTVPGLSLPATMRAGFLDGPGSLTLRDVAVPRPGAGEVLVRVEAALTCGTDIKLYQRGHARLPTPTAFGHEFSGRIAALGAGVTAFDIGDAIACVPTAPCGNCPHCERGRENLCADAIGRMVLGAFAQYILLPQHIVERHLFPRPAALTAPAAAVLEPLACVVHGASRVEWSGVRHTVIVGDGPIALLFARVAVLRGVPAVLVLGRHETRLRMAAEFGARTAAAHTDDDARQHVASFTTSGGADLVIECVGTPAAWRLASELAGTGGTVLLFGGCAAGSEATFDAYHMHYDEVDHVGAFHYTPRAVHEALWLLTSGAVPAASLITHTLPLDRLHDALELAMTRTAIKVAVVP
jgi:L-iditol 2-dehydrogenase